VIAPASHHGRISAHGFAIGYVGSLLALGAAAAFAHMGWIHAVWIMVAAQWAIGAIPALRYLPGDAPTGMSVTSAALTGLQQTLDTLKRVWGMRNLRRFLLGYFLYMDGVNTVITFAAVYASTELGFGATESIAMFAMVQFTALVGSLLMAGPSDRRGPRWVVMQSLVWWTIVVVLAIVSGAEGFAWRKPAFWIIAGLAGLGLGCIQAASRAFMSHLIPRGREAEFFGFYALCGKTGAILGPILLVGVGALLGSLRLGLVSVVAFLTLGYLLVRGVRDPIAVPDDRS
jgi:UMF1 family MFS transporter